MPIKCFYIETDGSEVVDVGLRPALIYYGTSVYNLRVVAHNLVAEDPSKNRVEMVVKGDRDRIDLFYNFVKEHDIRPVKQGSMYKIKEESRDYTGDEPDWDYCLSTVNAEQMFKGIGAISEINVGIQSINSNLSSIDQKFGVLIDRFGIFGEYMKLMDEKLDTHANYLKRISTGIDKLKGRKSRSKGKRK